MERHIEERVREWQSEHYDESTRNEVHQLVRSGNETELVDRFYRDLDFGTGGLRGVMGAGTNRMNVYTVRRATQGLADYMIAQRGDEARRRGVVVAWDSRRNSELFAHEVARVFAGNGVTVHLFDALRPTPELSFAVRYVKALAGVNVTASHNPPQYNGYKVYWEDGAQVTPPHDTGIIEYVRRVASSEAVRLADEESARRDGLIVTIGENVDEAYYRQIESLSLGRDLVKEFGPKTSIVYTPLHGAGYRAVPEMLQRLGFTSVHSVTSQELPDGDFPTVEAPNPEVQSSMQLALTEAAACGAQLVMGTDADADRLGVAVPERGGGYRLLTGNQIGTLLVDYYLRALSQRGRIPADGAVIKTIVTTELIRAVAHSHGVDCFDVLTGFKWIGRMMLAWERAREEERESHQYLVGGEESYGYLAGDFVRDKDAVIAACLLAEAAVDCQSRGQSLLDRLDELYLEHGLYHDALANVMHEGKEGSEKIAAIMHGLRRSPPVQIGDSSVLARWDVQSGVIYDSRGVEDGHLDLPESNVLVFFLDNGCRITARPSGTEPKIKFYVAVHVPPQSRGGMDALAAMRERAELIARTTIDAFLRQVEESS